MNWLASRLYDRIMESCEEACLRQWREELLSSVSGRVLEVGAGTGANVSFYPHGVDEVVLAEPEPLMRRQIEGRIPEARRDIFRITGDRVEDLAATTEQFDTVVLTLVLCSVPDAKSALRAIFEALRPGGRLVFIEHVASEKTGRRRIQGVLEPLWRRCAGNCHLTRQTEEAIGQAGFEFESITRESLRGALPWVRPSIRGVAQRPMN